MDLPAPLGIDSDCMIYLTEHPGSARFNLLRASGAGQGLELVASTLTLAELMVKWHATGDQVQARARRAAYDQIPGLKIADVTADIADRAAEIRATTRLKLPDAVHLATAQLAGAAAFLTNDTEVASAVVDGLPILRLDDLVAQL